MPRWNDYRGDYYYEPSRPRPVKDGIKAKSERGAIGESWWSKRWVEVLESFELGNRLSRGRSYARKGQVASLEVEKGQVKAQVQGSQPRPYRVSIKLQPLTGQEWERVTEAMAGQAIFAAKLLAGEMPRNIEQAFAAAGVALFPKKLADLNTECSCPDWSNPCKHLAAVYYILAEQFDEDPFLIFKLRGRTKEEIIQALREKRVADQPEEIATHELPGSPTEAEPEAPALEACLENFWQAGPELEELAPQPPQGPEVQAALLRRLGPLTFVDNKPDPLASLAAGYTLVADAALLKAGE